MLDGTGGVTLTTAITGNITGNLSGSVGSVTGNVSGSIGSLAAQAKADVQAEAEEALQTYHLDHFIASADPGSIVANSSLLAKLTSKSATPAFSSFDNTTDSLEAIRDKQTDIETDTQDLQSRVPAALVGGRIDANVGAISGDSTAADNEEAFFDGTGYAGTNNTIPTVTTVSNGVTVTTNNDKTGYRLSATGVDDILDEAITEPAGVFAWGSATLRNIIGWVGALARNKMTQTSTTQTLRNDADSSNISTSTHADDGTTHTRGEWS
jgi:hypothetical protein